MRMNVTAGLARRHGVDQIQAASSANDGGGAPRQRPAWRRVGSAAAAVVLLSLASALHAQPAGGPNPPADPVEYYRAGEEARRALSAGEFARAAELCGRQAAAQPGDGEAWLCAADSRFMAGDFRGAIAAYRRADALGFARDVWHNPQDSIRRSLYRPDLWWGNLYMIARSWAKLGERDSAFVYLQRSLDERRTRPRHRILQDEHLASLRGDPRLARLAGWPTDSLSRDEGWRYDLDFLMREIRRLNSEYGGPEGRGRPLPNGMEERAARLRGAIPRLHDDSVWVAMQQILGALHQGHNGLYAFAGRPRIRFTQLPLTLYAFEDGLYVIDAAPGLDSLIGARITRVGRTSADSAMAAVRTLISEQSPMETLWLGPYFLTIMQNLHGLGLVPSSDRARLTVVDRQGRPAAVELTPVPLAPRRKLFPSRLAAPGTEAPLYLRNVSQPFSDTLAAPGLLYVAFNQVSPRRDETLMAYGLRLRERLSRGDVRDLVVDVRQNNGGDDATYKELLRTLIAFEGVPGRTLYVIIGRTTYSAANSFIVDLHRLTNAVFVGEPSSGTPKTYGPESGLLLPWSGLNGSTSFSRWQLGSPYDERIYTTPRVPAPLTSALYFANRDPAMEAIMRLVRLSPP